MSDTGGLKSSLELALERLRQKDEAAGVASQPLSDAQKAAISEIRNIYDAKLAEQDILQQSAVAKMFGDDPAEIDAVTSQFRLERERLAAERDRKVEKIRAANQAD